MDRVMARRVLWSACVPPAFRPITVRMAMNSRQEIKEDTAEDFGRWHSRGYLPHFDAANIVQTLTLRLGDSLPAAKLDEWKAAQKLESDVAILTRIESYLDGGCGQCFLRDPRIASIVESALLHFDGTRYNLIAWVIMPNHVHAMLETRPGHSFPEVMHSLKSFTSKEANKILSRTGKFWEPDYFDRYVRNQNHFGFALRYIHENPVHAGLCDRAEDWRFSSARRRLK